MAATRLLVIWDGSPIHRRAEVQGFVSETRGKVWLEALPGYAPDLNPWDEGGWHHLKDVEMRNLVCRDLEELHQEFHLAVGRLGQKPYLVQSFFAQAVNAGVRRLVFLSGRGEIEAQQAEQALQASAAGLTQWDSLATLNLLALIEEEFGVSIDLDELEAPSFKTFLEMIGSSTGGQVR